MHHLVQTGTVNIINKKIAGNPALIGIKESVPMKKSILFLSLLLGANWAIADKNCFLARENGQTLQSEGDCNTAYTPQSTFKIPLSLMGFDAGLLKDESHPIWSIPAGEDPYINVCKSDHSPKTWMRDSCLWYSRVLTKKLGMPSFKNYLKKFDYGNQDLSGEKGKNNGLTHAWITSSLTISPREQTDFLQKLANNTLPVSELAKTKTRQILFIQELPGGWKLYGKTGSGVLKDQQGNQTDLQQGWFVGFIEKEERKIVFASHVVDTKAQKTYASLRARNKAYLALFYLINRIA